VWKLPCPLKTRILLWLALANRLLTWDDGQKRNCVGTDHCILCKCENESVHHLFVTCAFVFMKFDIRVGKVTNTKDTKEGLSIS